MASTYTPAGIELITTGEQSGTWGSTTNTNLELIEELATGVVGVPLTSTTYTLTTSDGVSSVGRHAVVVFSGTPGGTCTVTVSPNDMQKLYFVKNGSNQTVTLTQGSGSNVNIAAGDSAIVYCDGAGAGAAVVDFTSTFNFASYGDTTANFTGTLQNGGSNVVVDSDIGSTVQPYDADTAKYDAATANFTGTLQNGGSNVVVDSDIGSTVQAYDADLTALGGLAKTDGNFIVGNGSTWVAESGATARASLGLTIGTNVQAYDADLTALGGLAKTDGNFIVGNGSTWVAESGATARTSLGLGSVSTENTVPVAKGGTGATDAGTARTNLGLAIGTNVQAYDADLTALGGLAKTDGNFIVGNGSTWVAESGATARTSLGLGTAAVKAGPTGDIVGTTDTQTLSNKTITNLVFDGNFTEEVYTISDGASVDLNPANGTIQLWTLGASRSPTASSFAAGQSMTLMVDDGTDYAITWPSVTWLTDSGTAPTLATTGFTTVVLWKVSTTLYGARVGDNA